MLVGCVVGFSLLGRAAGHVLLPSAVVPSVHRVRIEDPYRTGGMTVHWLRGNLHTASVRGTGRDLPKALRDFYLGHGYQFLGISDLNTYTWTDEYRASSLTAVPMIEASYPFGNLLALYMDHWLPAQSLQGAVDWIDREGGYPILAAPRSPDRPLRDADILRLHRLFGIEVFDARLASSTPSLGDATALWDQLLSRGQRVFAFAGDDLTSLQEQSSAQRAWITVLSPRTDLITLLAAIDQGAFYASTGASFSSLSASGKTISVASASDATIRFIGKGGRLLSTSTGTTGSYTVRGNEGYVRVELQTSDGGRAWSQPYWIT